jgi:hypothetical protein
MTKDLAPIQNSASEQRLPGDSPISPKPFNASLQDMIYEFRGHKVMLDSDLAALYQVEAKRLNEIVKRNIERFPKDFMFQLDRSEFSDLKSQIATSSWGGKRKLPNVFTEQGIAMLSGLLNSRIAIAVNIQIMRTFVKMRHLAVEHRDLKERIQDLEQYLIHYAKENNAEIDKINKAIDLLMDRTKPARVGFLEGK